MSEPEVTILDPIAKPKASGLKLAARPADIKGMTVGFLDNGWWSFGLFIDRAQKLLAERYGVGGTIHLKKPKSSAATKQVGEMAGKCQLVINGLGN